MSAPISGQFMPLFDSESGSRTHALSFRKADEGGHNTVEEFADLRELSRSLTLDRLSEQELTKKKPSVDKHQKSTRWILASVISGDPQQKVYMQENLLMGILFLSEIGTPRYKGMSFEDRQNQIDSLTHEELKSIYEMILGWLNNEIARLCLENGIIQEGQKRRVSLPEMSQE